MERIKALEPWAALIVGEPVKVVWADLSHKHADGQASWDVDEEIRLIELSHNLKKPERMYRLPYVLYHECAHHLLGHLGRLDAWQKVIEDKGRDWLNSTPTDDVKAVIEPQADEVAYRLMEELAHVYPWDFINGTLVIVDGEPVYVWDTDEVITISE